jgi:integrase
MAKLTRADLATRTSRKHLKQQHRPHFLGIGKGVSCGYAQSKRGAGSWRGRGPDLKEFYIGVADDVTDANGVEVLNIDQAIAAVLAEIEKRKGGVSTKTSGCTLKQAFEEHYPTLLQQNGKARYNAITIYNHIRKRAPSYVALDVNEVTEKEWRDLRTTLLANGCSVATWNRQVKNLCACLNLVAKSTKNRWLPHLKVVSRGAGVVLHNNVVLTEEQVAAWVAAGYEDNYGFGLYLETLAETGTRPDQAARIKVGHLRAKSNRLNIPKAGKGRDDPNVRKNETYPVYISPELTAKLVAIAKGRGPEECLLLRDNGQDWSGENQRAFTKYCHHVTRTLKAIDLEKNNAGKKVTLYALRHTLITQRVTGKQDDDGNYIVYPLPTLVVAKAHDTSVSQIEKHYAADINDDPAVERLLRATLPTFGIGHNGGPPLEEEVKKAA